MLFVDVPLIHQRYLPSLSEMRPLRWYKVQIVCPGIWFPLEPSVPWLPPYLSKLFFLTRYIRLPVSPV